MELANLSSFERLTGKFLFTPTGDTGAIDLGNLEAVKSSYNPKTVDIMLNQRGHGVLARRDQSSVLQVFTINGNQFHTSVIKLLLMGDKNSDVTQNSGSGVTFSFTALRGRSYFLGKRNISNLVVAVSAATKTVNVDYFADLYNGIVRLPETPAGIADAATVDCTFDAAAVTLESYTALTKLNRQGTMQCFLEDESGPPAKEEWSGQCQLTTKDMPDAGDPSKFRTWAMEMAVFGNPTVYKRPS